MRRSFRTGSSAFVLFTALVFGPTQSTISVAPAHAEEQSVEECVGFTMVEVDTGLAYELVNDCARRVHCHMSWTLVCGDDSQGPAHSGQRHLPVAAGTSERVAISVVACADQSWRVENIEWACDGA